ncbi:MAG TPA: ABC transporter permease [Segetibacter sp.]|jgi:putative ABC transport system permease protein
MIKNFFKVAIRNMARHKGFSFINIAGLSLGLTACLLIGLFVADEKQFDKFIPDGDRVHRIYYEITTPEGASKIATTPPMFTTALQQQFPEVEKTLRMLSHQSKELVEAGGKKLYEERGIFTDPAFFEFFPLQMKYGSSKGALNEPTSIVISEEMAIRYFGNKNPIGKQVVFSKEPLQVKAVFYNNPKFHLPVNYIIPMAVTGISGKTMESWEWYGLNNYIKLRKGADADALQAKFQEYVKPFLKGEGASYKPFFQSLNKIHLYSSDFKYDFSLRGNITYVKGLTIIAIFILLIACFNFINLATAKSLQRAKEVGVRKTIGAGRKQLILQFIGETVLFAFISICISVAVTYLVLPSLNQFTEKHISFNLFTNPVIALSLVGLTLVVGILAGFYPALVLSSFQPVKVLKGAFISDATPGKIPWLRHGLVVIQFSLSVLLIISAIVVIRQVNYLHNKDLGFNKEQLMFFPMRGDVKKNYESFKNEIAESPGVSSVSVGYGFPGDIFGDGLITVQERPSQAPVKATLMMVDEDYIKTLGLQLIAGRDFSKEIKTDKDAAFIINETAAKDLGFASPEKAVGQTLNWPTWAKQDSLKKAQVVGVVKDFHFKSLYDKVEPAILQIYPMAYSKVAVKVKTAGLENTLAHVKNTWSRFTSDFPIEYNFLDESYAKMYKADDKLRSLLTIFTAITIFVGCLGLFGLAAYAAERRRKEVGIRKVLGASVKGIVFHLSKDFIKLVFVALLIASPLAAYFMNEWLQDFPYRINISWWIFALAAIIAVVIAIITISFQAIKAAIANPVSSLRTE